MASPYRATPIARLESSMLELLDISKRFNGVSAVRSFSLSIHDSEFFVIVGPSGCGKTTLLRLLAGLERPDHGTILMNGEDWTRISPQRRNVAMVFQQHYLYPHRTVRGNIEYPLRIRKISARERAAKIAWIAGLLDISELLGRHIHQLSGGEAQRVALARALVRNPRCFLMDEPLSSLDPLLRTRARGEIRRLQRALGVTTLYVTHDQEEALALADRVGVMNDGALVQVATPDELFQSPETAFVASFIGRPGMNLFSGEVLEASSSSGALVMLRVDKEVTPSAYVRIAVSVGTKLLIGIRSGDIEIMDGHGVQQPGWVVKCTMSLSERTEDGFLNYCYFASGQQVAVRSVRRLTGEQTIFIPASRVHYFESLSGARVSTHGAGT